ncbi:hypothetical protein V5F48_17465, partial [Xanthobacter autotrophicus ATCC 700552]
RRGQGEEDTCLHHSDSLTDTSRLGLGASTCVMPPGGTSHCFTGWPRIRSEDVFVVITDAPKENWSVGRGVQFA